MNKIDILKFGGQILLYLLAGAGGAGGIAILIRKLLRGAKVGLFKRGLDDIREVYEDLQEALAHSSADRILVMKAENGGGIPKAGARLRVSVVYEVYDRTSFAVRDSWEKREVDAEYVEMLAKIFASKHTTVDVPKLSEGSPLRDAYEAAGIARSEVFSIGMIDEAFAYLSVPCETKGSMSAEERSRITGLVSRLRRRFKARGCVE